MAYLLRLRYHANYSFDDAKLHEWYTLEKLSSHNRRFFKHANMKWKPVKEYTYVGAAESMKSAVSGNLEWAKKIAKDFGIPLPIATHRLSQQDTRSTQTPTRGDQEIATAKPHHHKEG